MSTVDSTHVEEIQRVAISAAVHAGRLIRSKSGNLRQEEVANKGVHDLVTDIDRASQSLIVSAISAHFPSHQILAEEDESHDLTPHAPDGDFRWIIDPIDGTTNFTHGVPPYAVSIGVQKGSEMVIGVVYDVSRDELFSAIRGGSLQLNGRPANVSATTELDNALITTGFPYREFADIDAYLTVLKSFMRATRGVRRPGSAAVDLAWVAAGRFDGFFETGLAPWDMAAGVLLVESGGGRVTDYQGSTDAVFSKQVLASNGHLHEHMMKLAEPMRQVHS